MSRRHDIDALRVIAFALLILYHVGMLYVFDWGWHVKSSYQAEWLQYPMLFMNRWRMSLLFLLSGIAIGLLNPTAWAGRFAAVRTWRLFLPLLFGMFVIVPVQAYCQGVSNGLVAPGFGQFLLNYWTFQPWPEKAFDGADVGITWNHLWYLAYIWVYTLILSAGMRWLASPRGERLRARFTGMRGYWLIGLPPLLFLANLSTLGQWFEPSNDLVSDWFQHVQYFSVFLIGWALGRDTAIWDELVRLRRRTLGIALGCAAVYVPLVLNLDDGAPLGILLFARSLRSLYMWTALLSILGWALVYLNRPFAWLPRANDAVYPWYILHQSLIVLIAYWLIPLRIGPVLEPLLVIGGTLGGSWLLYEGLIRRVNLLRPLFGMKRLPPRPAVAVAATPCA